MNGVSPGGSTNVVSSGSSTNVTQLGNVTVVGKLNQARNQIVPDLGATAFTINKDQIATLSQGGNAPMNQVVLRAPGVAEDSAANGDLHVRGEHANLQYRINDVLLPEGITGFGLELDPRFVESMQLITGSLPAQYGFRTAGVVDIQTKSGAFENGGEVGVYGGSYDTMRPSFEYGGAQGKWDYFVDGSYDHNDLGIENPTPSHDAIHDQTDQYKTFVYASRILSDTSRISLMGSASYSNFQVPNTPGLPPGTATRRRPLGRPEPLIPVRLERKSKRAELLRRGDLPKIGRRSEFSSLRLWPQQQRAFHARPHRGFVLQRRGQRRRTENSILAGCKPMPVTTSATSIPSAAA